MDCDSPARRRPASAARFFHAENLTITGSTITGNGANGDRWRNVPSVRLISRSKQHDFEQPCRHRWRRRLCYSGRGFDRSTTAPFRWQHCTENAGGLKAVRQRLHQRLIVTAPSPGTRPVHPVAESFIGNFTATIESSTISGNSITAHWRRCRSIVVRVSSMSIINGTVRHSTTMRGLSPCLAGNRL